jgi:hypothetical protein
LVTSFAAEPEEDDDDADVEFDAVSVHGAFAPGPAMQPTSASAVRLALARRPILVLFFITGDSIFIYLIH